MHIEKLTIENIKCFKNEEISFLAEDGKPAKWVTLIGENATGKTTILQILALLLAGVEDASNLMPEPNYWLHKENKPGRIGLLFIPGSKDFELYGIDMGERVQFGNRRIHEKQSSGISIVGNELVELNYKEWVEIEEGEFKEITRKKQFNKASIVEPDGEFPFHSYDFSFTEGHFAVAYGGFRRPARVDSVVQFERPGVSRVSGLESLFNEVPLATFNQWVSFLDYNRTKGDPDSGKALKIGIDAINNLMPDFITFDESTLAKSGHIQFLVQGKSLPVSMLSDGARSVLSFAGDVIWRLINTFIESDDVLKEEGIIIIDEFDAHLHPHWQSWIAQKLQSVFPNIQFIVATHSPLIAMGAYWNQETGQRNESVLTLKLEMNDGDVSVRKISDDIATMDIGRLLESPAFGMVAPRPPEVEAKIDRYDELIGKLNRTPFEEEEFQQLREFMAEARPIGGPPEPGSLQARMEAFLDKTLPR